MNYSMSTLLWKEFLLELVDLLKLNYVYDILSKYQFFHNSLNTNWFQTYTIISLNKYLKNILQKFK